MTGRPTAAPAYFPYKHDSMAVVMANECTECALPIARSVPSRLCYFCSRKETNGARFARYERERRSARG